MSERGKKEKETLEKNKDKKTKTKKTKVKKRYLKKKSEGSLTLTVTLLQWLKHIQDARSCDVWLWRCEMLLAPSPGLHGEWREEALGGER
jgi:hypothetical protein